jgi:hypothetical protein
MADDADDQSSPHHALVWTIAVAVDPAYGIDSRLVSAMVVRQDD